MQVVQAARHLPAQPQHLPYGRGVSSPGCSSAWPAERVVVGRTEHLLERQRRLRLAQVIVQGARAELEEDAQAVRLHAAAEEADDVVVTPAARASRQPGEWRGADPGGRGVGAARARCRAAAAHALASISISL